MHVCAQNNKTMKELKQEQIKLSNTIEDVMKSVDISENDKFKFSSKDAFNLFQNKFGVVDGGCHLIEDHRNYGFVLVKSARRSHKCTKCAGEIEKGSSYFYLDSFCLEHSIKISQWKICLNCDKNEVQEHNKKVLNNESLVWEYEYTYIVAPNEDGNKFHFIGKF